MNSFLYDLIHLTQGELLIKHWWVWITLILLCFGVLKLISIKKKANNN